jgi:hypothetical protein
MEVFVAVVITVPLDVLVSKYSVSIFSSACEVGSAPSWLRPWRGQAIRPDAVKMSDQITAHPKMTPFGP